MYVNSGDTISYLCWVFISLLSDCSSSPEVQSITCWPSAAKIRNHNTDGAPMFSVLLLHRDKAILEKLSALPPSNIKNSYFSTVMLNTTLHTQVKFHEKNLFASLEMPIGALFLAFVLHLFLYSLLFCSPLFNLLPTWDDLTIWQKINSYFSIRW